MIIFYILSLLIIHVHCQVGCLGDFVISNGTTEFFRIYSLNKTCKCDNYVGDGSKLTNLLSNSDIFPILYITNSYIYLNSDDLDSQKFYKWNVFKQGNDAFVTTYNSIIVKNFGVYEITLTTTSMASIGKVKIRPQIIINGITYTVLFAFSEGDDKPHQAQAHFTGVAEITSGSVLQVQFDGTELNSDIVRNRNFHYLIIKRIS